MKRGRERDALFAVLAAHLKGVSPWQLVDAVAVTGRADDTPLSDRLQAMDVLTPPDVVRIEALVAEAIRVCGGDVSAALASMHGGTSLGNSLFEDLQVQSPNKAPPTRPMDPNALLKPGEEQVLGIKETAGRYAEIAECGRGGMGRVWAVHDTFLGREIALKELLLATEGSSAPYQTPSWYSRFLQEARISSQLQHPAIVPVYELGRRVDGTP